MQELTEEALVAASVDTVWTDFTDADSLTEWIWPPRFDTKGLVDLEPQGRWAIRSAVADLAVDARILAIDAPRSLRLQWRWEGEEHTTDAEITLEPAADDATRVIVRHTGFLSAAEREEHVEGWTNCLQRLVARHGPPPRG